MLSKYPQLSFFYIIGLKLIKTLTLLNIIYDPQYQAPICAQLNNTVMFEKSTFALSTAEQY